MKKENAKGKDWASVPVLDLAKIESINFPTNQYLRQVFPKTQIVWHHSAGWDNARGMFAGWAADKPRVATCCGITDDGTVHQCFSSKYYAWHVNILSAGNVKIYADPKYNDIFTRENAQDVEKRTVGVEVCNWGPLTEIDGEYHTWASSKKKKILVPEKKVIYYPEGWRGYYYFERYTDREIESLYKLTKYWMVRYEIEKPKIPEKRWLDVNTNAIAGVPGIWGHHNYRIDKNDIHPQPELLEMFRAL